MKISTLFFSILLLSNASILFGQTNELTSYKNYFDDSLKEWTQSFKNFELPQFKQTGVLKFENLPFGDPNDINEFYRLYKPALTYSEDKSKFIDIYSYWLNLERKENKIISNRDVEQAISLYDTKTKKWTRILFCGYSSRIDEVVWLTDTKFILAGSSLDNKNFFHPQILIGDTNKKQFFVYANEGVDYRSD